MQGSAQALRRRVSGPHGAPERRVRSAANKELENARWASRGVTKKLAGYPLRTPLIFAPHNGSKGDRTSVERLVRSSADMGSLPIGSVTGRAFAGRQCDRRVASPAIWMF